MKIFITHLVAFLVGVIVTALLLINRADVSLSKPQDNDSQSHLSNENFSQNTAATKVKTYSSDKDQLIEQQALEIERLTRAVQSVREELNASLLAAKKNSPSDSGSKEQTEAPLRTMNMQTFEESMKTQFTDQFKGIVLQLEGQRLEDIKQSYNNSSEKNEWSNQYENSIANFLAAHDENGDHYLQSLNCNTNVCRLEVNTNDADNWNSLYAKMTNESWYQSITVQEQSDYPGNVIYYLPSLNN
ncbi:MAG: hypothetical protein ABJI60_20920 [Kangiellaceae bacterium]